jgi:hypothetical protein
MSYTHLPESIRVVTEENCRQIYRDVAFVVARMISVHLGCICQCSLMRVFKAYPADKRLSFSKVTSTRTRLRIMSDGSSSDVEKVDFQVITDDRKNCSHIETIEHA